jgi:hypothetical protein
MSPFQFTRRYRRGSERREVEVDNKLVFLRGSGMEEQRRAFLEQKALEDFLVAHEGELAVAGFKRHSEKTPPPYDHAQARKDFKRVGASAGLPAEELKRVVRTVRKYPNPLVYLRCLFREADGAREGLTRRGGMLWNICFAATDEELLSYTWDYIDPDLAPELSEGVVFGAADADAWVDVDGDVWHVHPEECNGPTAAREFMEEQVRAALEETQDY